MLVSYSTESTLWSQSGAKIAILLNTLCTNEICTPAQTAAGLRTFVFRPEINAVLSTINGIASGAFFDIFDKVRIS